MKKLIIGMLLILSTFTFASGSQYKDYKDINTTVVWSTNNVSDVIKDIKYKGWDIIEIIYAHNVIIVYGTLKE